MLFRSRDDVPDRELDVGAFGSNGVSDDASVAVVAIEREVVDPVKERQSEFKAQLRSENSHVDPAQEISRACDNGVVGNLRAR